MTESQQNTKEDQVLDEIARQLREAIDNIERLEKILKDYLNENL